MADNIPEAALEKLGQLHDHRFFQQLASGPDPIVPQTPAEREQLLKLAFELRQRHDAHMQKQASSGNPFLASALDSLLGAEQPANQLPHAGQFGIKQAAAEYAGNEELAKAALEYHEWIMRQSA